MQSALTAWPRHAHEDALLETAPTPIELLVLWQNPVSRSIVPIGRLQHDDGVFTFRYTQAALQEADFRPLAGLPDLTGVYRGHELPPVFDQRIMSDSNPGYRSYLRSIGVKGDRAQVTPWEQLLISGGRRQGDTLQFMELPTVIDGRARARFLVSGIRYVSDHFRHGQSDLEQALRSLDVLDPVRLVAEHDNEYDENAVVVTTTGRMVLGWVPQLLSASVRALLPIESGTTVMVANPDAPSHLQLVVDLETPAPDGFTFDPTGAWGTATEG